MDASINYMKQLLPLKITKLNTVDPYTNELYVISRNNQQLGDAVTLDQAKFITKWLDSISSYYDEELEEWIIN